MKKAFTEEMYQTAVRKLREDGYIKRTYLLKLFGVREVDRVHSFFESHDNPLYEELIEEDVHVKGRKSYKRRIKIYKPFTDLVAKWRKENCRNGLYTNTPYQHMGLNV